MNKLFFTLVCLIVSVITGLAPLALHEDGMLRGEALEDWNLGHNFVRGKGWWVTNRAENLKNDLPGQCVEGLGCDAVWGAYRYPLYPMLLGISSLLYDNMLFWLRFWSIPAFLLTLAVLYRFTELVSGSSRYAWVSVVAYAGVREVAGRLYVAGHDNLYMLLFFMALYYLYIKRVDGMLVATFFLGMARLQIALAFLVAIIITHREFRVQAVIWLLVLTPLIAIQATTPHRFRDRDFNADGFGRGLEAVYSMFISFRDQVLYSVPGLLGFFIFPMLMVFTRFWREQTVIILTWFLLCIMYAPFGVSFRYVIPIVATMAWVPKWLEEKR